jgi:hypothetical protein
MGDSRHGRRNVPPFIFLSTQGARYLSVKYDRRQSGARKSIMSTRRAVLSEAIERWMHSTGFADRQS